MNKNMQRLGATLSDRMKRTADGAVPTTIELGVINSNLSLTTDSLQAAIPKGEYMVNITLISDTYRTSMEIHSHDEGNHIHSGGAHGGHESGDGSHSHGGGEHTHVGGKHDHRLPVEFRQLKAGDRVLVAWCGVEPVVVAIVSASSVLNFSDSNTSTGGGSTGSDEGGSESGDTGTEGSGSSGQGGAEVESIVQEVVTRVMDSIESKFYTKEQINTKFEEEVITGEEIRNLIADVFSNK